MQSRKRTRNQAFPDSNDGNAAKRLKTEEYKIKSKLFHTDDGDQKQFKDIFEAIKSSTISTKMSTPCDIIKEIAEYATGNIKPCNNKDCNADIHRLHDHYDNISNDNERGYGLCRKSVRYWCSECMCALKECEEGAKCKIHPADPHCANCSEYHYDCSYLELYSCNCCNKEGKPRYARL